MIADPDTLILFPVNENIDTNDFASTGFSYFTNFL